ncbi:centromere protein P isoform X4 [Bubalus kerabau]|uniref:centromere protein P isoform X4 n=1 Tax=Bubalus carabanensis TaxID=3119969 RepID=UPI00244ED398|nr:centromere protein P isoform X4 [Bubalus carabanensis]
MATSRRHLRDRVIGAGIARGSLASPAEFRNGSLQERARLEEPDLARLSQAASRQHSSMDSQRAKARALEAEITALRRACIETQAPGDDDSQVRKSFQETHQSDSEEWGLSKDLRSHLGSLESELQFLSRLTGISIRNYCKNTEDLTSTEMAEKSIKKVLQRHRLSGNCHMITFQLEYQILEIQDKESLSSVITDLSIIMEPTEYSELSEFVSSPQSCPTLCNPIDCSTPGLPIPYHLPKFAQVHVHCIGDAIQPSHPLMPSSPLPSVFPSIRDISSESAVCIRSEQCTTLE